MSDEKIIELLNQINDKVDKIAVRLDTLEARGTSAGFSNNTGDSTVSPSDVVWEEKQSEKDVTSGGRLKCPKCGAVGNDIAKEQDKDNVITYIGGVPQYGLKYYCKKCMEKWTQ